MKRSRVAIALMALALVAGGTYAAVRLLAPASDDAVKLVPRQAIFYANAFLEPSTRQKLALEDLIAHFDQIATPDEAGDALAELLDRVLAGSGLSFQRDVEPWLGAQMALFFTSVGPDAHGALLISSTDDDAARAALNRSASAQGRPDERSYQGTAYLVAGDTASAVVSGFAVIGSEPGLRAVVDVASGRAESLAGAASYRRATANIERDRLGLLYFDLGRAGRGANPGLATSLLGGQDALAVVVFARPKGLVLEVSLPAEAAASPATAGWASLPGLTAELPASAWFAGGAEGLGARLQTLFDLAAKAGPGLDLDTVAAQLRAAFGFDLHANLLDWMGSFGLFLSGTTPEELRGALVIEALDRAAATSGLIELEAVLNAAGVPLQPDPPGGGPGFALPVPGLPEPLVVIDGGGRVVVALGREAADQALHPPAETGQGELYARAARALGEGFELSLLVDAAALRSFAEASGALGDPAYANDVRPWLEPLAFIAAGSRSRGDVVVSRVMIGVR